MAILRGSSAALTYLRCLISLTIIALWSGNAMAQEPDSIKTEELKLNEPAKITMLMYMRIIQDAGGNVRMDENVVSNFKLNKWLRLELGIRQGERPQRFGSYDHYKIEVQTKTFLKSVRFLARLSDNIIQYPSPAYVKSNYLLVAEGKRKIGHSVTALFSYGYVFTCQRNDINQAEPIAGGISNNYPTYKIGLRYALNDKGFLEATYGAYDVFNPYLLSSPFTQATFDYEISRRWALYSYFRYQFYESLNKPLNYFTAFGAKLKFN